MKLMKKLIFSSAFVLIITIFQSCVTVKPYQKIYLNDSEMQMGADNGKNFHSYVHSIREGATPVATPKSSGGCGCN